MATKYLKDNSGAAVQMPQETHFHRQMFELTSLETTNTSYAMDHRVNLNMMHTQRVSPIFLPQSIKTWVVVVPSTFCVTLALISQPKVCQFFPAHTSILSKLNFKNMFQQIRS